MVFFLLAGAPGFWFPALSNVLDSYGLGEWTEVAFLLPSVMGMVTPMILGAQVDQRFQAQKVLGIVMISGAVFLFLAFYAIEKGWGGGWFITFFAINAFISAPAWSLLITIALAGLDDPKKTFGLYRVWGTLGWMIAGGIVSFAEIDFSPATGQIASGLRVVAGVCCFLMPVVIPKGAAKSLGDALGFGAVKILRDRDQLVYFVTAFIFHIPLASLYIHTPMMLREMGVTAVSGTMAVAQVVETFAMLSMGFVIARFRVKWILFVAIFFGLARYALCGVGDHFGQIGWVILGVMLHGISWTFFVEAGRVFIDRRVEPGMRGQAQALMSFVSSGLGGVLGVLVVKYLHSTLVDAPGAPGWVAYWNALTLMCLVALGLFGFGYRGLKGRPEDE
ncbi:MAG: MFS transporter [Verrucomicrobiaceae bacterium]